MRTVGRWSALIGIVALVAIATAWWVDVLSAASTPAVEATLIRIGSGETPSYTVPPGGEQTITVEVAGAVNLGTATLLLAYDPALVQVMGCTAQSPTGADLALCNPAYSPGVVRFSLLSSAGVNGNFPLFTLTLAARATSGNTAQLDLTAPQFADTQGAAMPVQVSGGSLLISGPEQPVEALLRLAPAASEIFPGQLATIGIQLDVLPARPVGAATLLLQYDPQIVRPVLCTPAAASIIQGACNVNFNRTQGLIKFNLLAGEGASGLLDLYDVLFEVVGTAIPNAISPLTLSAETLNDTQSAPLRWRAEDGSLTVGESPSNAAQLRVGDGQSGGQFSLAHGETITVPVWVVDVADLGAATLSLDFDPVLLQPLGCTVDAATPGIDGGHCVIEAGRVRANFLAGQGFSGSAPLFQVIFTPRPGAPAGAITPLLLDASSFAHVNASPLAWRASHGEISLLAGAASDVPLFQVDAPVTAPPSLAQDGEVNP
jgi:hypothetical protein